MARFRFRAQVALDLRQKQDEDARRILGEAKRATAAAERALDEERRVLAEALARAAREEAQASDTTRAIWYRNWMKRQQQVIELALRVAEKRRAEEREAAERAVIARRKLRALERLRDRTWKAFQVAEQRAEQKELDVLGGLRYVARERAPGGLRDVR